MLWRSIVVFVFLAIQVTQSSLGESEIISHPHEHPSCNKGLCASIVSYCMIQEKCGCHPSQNCSCCAECAVCLGDYYRHCCDCVGMRPGNNYTTHALPTILSTVGMLDEPAPKLFKTLTDKPMPTLRYTILRFPILGDLPAHRHRVTSHRGQHHHDRATEQDWNEMQMVLQRDYEEYSGGMCTATYFDRCMPLNECSWSCERVGASSFRWFHNGCCECAGETCLNYGNRFPKCTECMV